MPGGCFGTRWAHSKGDILNIVDIDERKETEVAVSVEIIRKRRELECFPVINRGVLWYNCLTFEQRSELNGWYHSWLNATETGVIPSKPEWLNNKIEREEILL